MIAPIGQCAIPNIRQYYRKFFFSRERVVNLERAASERTAYTGIVPRKIIKVDFLIHDCRPASFQNRSSHSPSLLFFNFVCHLSFLLFLFVVLPPQQHYNSHHVCIKSNWLVTLVLSILLFSHLVANQVV